MTPCYLAETETPVASLVRGTVLVFQCHGLRLFCALHSGEITCLCQKMKVSLLWCGDTKSMPCWLSCSAASLKQYTTKRYVNVSIQWNEVLVAKQSFGDLNCLMCIKLWERFKISHEYHKYCIFWIISSNKSTGNRKWRQGRMGPWCLSLELPVFLDEITILQWHGTESMEKAERHFQFFYTCWKKKRVSFWLKSVIWLLPKRSVWKTCTVFQHAAWCGITGWLRVAFEDMNFLPLEFFVHWHGKKKLFWHFRLAMSMSYDGKPVSVQTENHPCGTDRRCAEE